LQPARIQELGRAWISQAYDLSQPLDTGKDGTATEKFSGVDLGLRATPVSYFGAFGQVTYSIADKDLRAATVGMFITDPRSFSGEDDLFLNGLRPRNSASVSYRFIEGSTLFLSPTLPSRTEDVNLTGTLRLTDRLALSYQGRFDAVVGRFLENRFGFRVISSCDCWVLDFAAVDRVNPDELEFRVLFSLVGLGSFGQQPFRPAYGSFATPHVGAGDLGARF
jgi:hypothetical protein